MISDALPPEFPTDIGGEVFFLKDGQEYRIARYGRETWIIHKKGVAPEGFELVLSPDGKEWAVEGRGHIGPVVAAGVTKGFVFSKLF